MHVVSTQSCTAVMLGIHGDSAVVAQCIGRAGGGLPTPYLAAGGVAVLAIIGIGLAGAKPDQAPAAPPTSSSSSSGSGSKSGASLSNIVCRLQESPGCCCYPTCY